VWAASFGDSGSTFMNLRLFHLLGMSLARFFNEEKKDGEDEE